MSYEIIVEFVKYLPEFLFAAGKWLAFLLIAVGLTWHFILHYHHQLPLGDTRLSRWLRKYSHHVSPSESVRATLKELGYDGEFVNRARHLIRLGVPEFDQDTTDQCCGQLVRLLARYTEYPAAETTYGRATPERSHYYMNSMAASLRFDDRETMARLMLWLLSKRLPKEQSLDFILVPKDGNPLFADAVALRARWLCLIRKHDQEASRARAAGGANPQVDIINIEGLPQLKALADAAGRHLYGAVIDCNCSGGSTINRAMEEFTRAARTVSVDASFIDRIFVLFRPDTSELTISTVTGERLQVERFFDLTEALKKAIYEFEARHSGGSASSLSSSQKRELDAIITSFRKQNLIKCEKGS